MKTIEEAINKICYIGKTRHVAIRLIIIFILFASQSPGLAQDNLNKQFWIDFNPYYFLTPKIELFGDVGARLIKEGENRGRIVIKPGIRTPIGNGFYLTGGIGNYYSINEGINDVWEIRPFQGIMTHWPRIGLFIQHYIRFEQRLGIDMGGMDNVFSMRLRYRLRLLHRWGAIQKDQYWTVTVGLEGFFKLDNERNQIEEHARITSGLERSFRRDLRVRLEITWQKETLRFTSENSTESIYIRLRFFQNIRS